MGMVATPDTFIYRSCYSVGLTKAGTKEEKIGLAHHEELTNYNTSPTIERTLPHMLPHITSQHQWEYTPSPQMDIPPNSD